MSLPILKILNPPLDTEMQDQSFSDKEEDETEVFSVSNYLSTLAHLTSGRNIPPDGLYFACYALYSLMIELNQEKKASGKGRKWESLSTKDVCLLMVRENIHSNLCTLVRLGISEDLS